MSFNLKKPLRLLEPGDTVQYIVTFESSYPNEKKGTGRIAWITDNIATVLFNDGKVPEAYDITKGIPIHADNHIWDRIYSTTRYER